MPDDLKDALNPEVAKLVAAIHAQARSATTLGAMTSVYRASDADPLIDGLADLARRRLGTAVLKNAGPEYVECDDCIFQRHWPAMKGPAECRRHAPRPTVDTVREGGLYPTWPAAEFGCGEGVPREEGPQ